MGQTSRAHLGHDRIATQKTPGVAVFGCGYWGRNLVRVFRDAGVLRAVVEQSEAARELARQIAPGVPIQRDPNAVWDDPSIDAVVIATPAKTHFKLALAALAAGKDVFVEKPLATDPHDALQMVQLANRLDRILMVGHLLEYHPAIVALLRLVRKGELGKIFYATSSRLNLGKIRSEENALWSFAPHDVAVLLRLMRSMPSQVSATGGSYIQPNIADTTVTQLLFDSGARAHIFVSWLHPFKEQRLVVVGSEKMATFDDVDKSLLLYDRRVDWEKGQPVPTRGEGIRIPYPDTEPLQLECRHFLDCVTRRERPITDGESGFRVLQVLAAAQRSMVMNGHPTPVPQETYPLNPQSPEQRGLQRSKQRGQRRPLDSSTLSF